MISVYIEDEDLKIKNSFHVYAIITIMFWSLAYVFTRMALQYFTPYSLGFLRYFIASCSLLVIVITKRIKIPEKSDILWFVISGAVGFFLYMIAFNRGSETVNASTNSVIIATVPIITAVFASIIYKERIQIFQWIAIAISFAGVITLTILNGVVSISSGIGWLFMAAILLSLYNLLQRKLTKKYSALQTSAYSIFAGTLLLAVFAPDSFAEATQAPAISLFYVITMGVFSSAVAYLSWSHAFAIAKNTSSVSNYMFATPFVTTFISFIIAGESPDIPTISGGVIILLGLFIFNFGGTFIKSK